MQSSTLSDGEDWGESSDSDCEEQPASVDFAKFGSLLEKIQKTIQQFDGSVFPKLNWSAPKDAAWMSPTGTLRCENASDVILLLKSSSLIVHDLVLKLVFLSCGCPWYLLTAIRPEKFYLVLRKWYDIAPSMEFRCFVRNSRLFGKRPLVNGIAKWLIPIGISQRDHATYYPFLPAMTDVIRDKIVAFFEAKIAGNFSEIDCMSTYAETLL